MIAIWVFNIVICSTGPLLPLEVDREGDLIFFIEMAHSRSPPKALGIQFLRFFIVMVELVLLILDRVD